MTDSRDRLGISLLGGFVLCILLAALASGCAPAAKPAPVTPPRVAAARPKPARTYRNVRLDYKLEAKEGYLVDNRTGTVLYEYNADAHIEPGSTAKLMTFYIALNALSANQVSLDSKVTIGDDAAALARNPTISRMFLKAGQQVTFQNLLYGMMVHSGCDAALAIADQIAGSGPTFVTMMNSEAHRLGMTNTHFTQPNGLPEPGEYVSARDMVILARTLIREHPETTKYTSRHFFKYNERNQKNTNSLLFLDPRVVGLKTGHVADGYHLIALARDQNDEFVGAVLGSSSNVYRVANSEILIDWAFENFYAGSPVWHSASAAKTAGVTPGFSMPAEEIPAPTTE